jgi:hypothetical protein
MPSRSRAAAKDEDEEDAPPRTPAPTPRAVGDRRFVLSNLRGSGAYILGDVTWDEDSVEGLSPTQLVHAIRTFVEMTASQRRGRNLGYIGGLVVESLDVEGQSAVVRFKSTAKNQFPQEILQRDEGVTRGLA